MIKDMIIALRVALVTLILTGIAYPLFVTGVAQVIFPGRANGSLAKDSHGTAVGSALIGQAFTQAAYFQPRPSAAGSGYDGLASSGSNLGPASAKLRDRMQADLARLQKENPDAPGPFPVELISASASGLDPHISPEAALWQVPRVAKARGVAVGRVQSMVEEYSENRDLGLLGELRVNVLQLNMALDRRFGKAY